MKSPLIWLGFLGFSACSGGRISVNKDDVTDCPNFHLEASPIVFEHTRIGLPTVQRLTLTNDCEGDESLAIWATLTDATGLSLPHSDWVIEPGQETQISVQFEAADYQTVEATLTLTSNDANLLTVQIPVRGTANPDQDGDGFGATEADGSDCDDTNPSVYPDAEEIYYDGIDANCDGLSDFDQDRDGADRVPEGLDCDDTNSAIFPGQPELENLIDDNCDGLADEPWFAAGDVLITEIMVDPKAVFDTTGEWFEVYNASSRDLNLIGWSVTDEGGETLVLDVPFIVRSGDYAVLAASATDNGGVSPDFVYNRAGFRLSNDRDALELVAGALSVSRVVYTLDWPVATGASLSLDGAHIHPAGLSDSGVWCAAKTPLSGGDTGTPGESNDWCDTVDHDGDGFSVADGDCDDENPSLFPGQIDWMNGLDDDCDGEVDVTAIDSLSEGSVTGNTGSQLGAQYGITVADVNGDGVLDVVMGTPFEDSRTGVVHVLDGDTSKTLSGTASAAATATLTGPGARGVSGSLSDKVADNPGEGTSDLLIGGSDYYTYYSTGLVSAALFSGGSSVSGALDVDDAEMTWTGATYWWPGANHSGADLTGDGLAEVLLGYSTEGSSSQGAVGIFLTSDLAAGNYDLDDADQVLSGEGTYQMLGSSVYGSDVDADGYDDAFLCGLGYYYGSTYSYAESACWLVMGQSSLGEDAEIDEVADVSWVEASPRGARFGETAAFGDVDDDGHIDLVIAAPGDNEVYLYLDIASLTGELDSGDADVTFVGASTPSFFGHTLDIADVDNDGVNDLVVSAPDFMLSGATTSADEIGQVYVFRGGSSWASRVTEADANWTVSGSSVGDGFGIAMAFADLDGDSVLDWVVSAPGENGGKGEVYFLGL